jgi:hypothetical protein
MDVTLEINKTGKITAGTLWVKLYSIFFGLKTQTEMKLLEFKTGQGCS